MASGLSPFAVGDRSMILYVGALSALRWATLLYFEASWDDILFRSPLGQVACYGWMSWQMVVSQGDSWSQRPQRETLVSK